MVGAKAGDVEGLVGIGGVPESALVITVDRRGGVRHGDDGFLGAVLCTFFFYASVLAVVLCCGVSVADEQYPNISDCCLF